MHRDEALSSYLEARDELTLIAILGQVPGDWTVRCIDDNGTRYGRAECIHRHGFVFGGKWSRECARYEIFHGGTQFARELCCCDTDAYHACNVPPGEAGGNSWT